MSFFSKFSDFITSPVGNALTNRPEDVRRVKQNFKTLGMFEEDADNGYITRGLDSAIKSFQRDNDLKVDGKINPRGETESRIFDMLEGGLKEGSATAKSKPAARPLMTAMAGKNTAKNTKMPQADATGRMINPAAPPVPKRRPETIAPTPKGDKLLDFIGKLESSDNYNVIAGGDEKPLTKMTVKEVRRLQSERSQQNLGTAVGRYQIIDDKMDDLIKWMSLDENAVFDEKLQNQMGRELLKRRGFEKYKAGKIGTEDFIKELSKEWAAIPVNESNESYYKGVGNNKALTDFKTIKGLLKKK